MTLDSFSTSLNHPISGDLITVEVLYRTDASASSLSFTIEQVIDDLGNDWGGELDDMELMRLEREAARHDTLRSRS